MGPDILNSYLLFYVIDKVSSREQRIIYSTRHPLPKAYFIWADTISIKYKVKTFRIDRDKATLTGQFLTIKYKKFTTTDRTDSDSMLIAYKSKKTEFIYRFYIFGFERNKQWCFSFRVHAWSGTRVPDPPVYVCRSRGPPNYFSASLAEWRTS